MSYVRFSEADVYVFLSADGLECCGCRLQQREWVNDPTNKLFGGHFQSIEPILQTTFTDTESMIDHLDDHGHAGHYVPQRVIEDLRADDAENFPQVKA